MFVSPHRKLSDQQAQEIRYRVGGVRNLSERAAAKVYGVSTRTIRGIVKGELYAKPGRKPRATHNGIPRPSADPVYPAIAAVIRKPLDLSGPAISLYRTEKVKADERRQRTILAEAKREYDAMLEREAAARKGGRPRTKSDFRGGRPNQMGNLRSDPADALLNALGTFEGAA